MSTTTSRRIRTTVQFSIASIVLRYRITQVFGNLSRCAASLGISRQALNQRMRSATKWRNTHDWFAALIDLPVELFAGDDLDAVMPTVRARPIPSNEERSKLSAAACSDWPEVAARSYQWPDAHKAARDARIASIAAAMVAAAGPGCAQLPE